jgi:hypothetical protein
MTLAQLSALAGWLTAALPTRLRGDDRDRGDIPGWVMIAIMSAAVVVFLIPLVGPTIADAFKNAIDNVTNTTSGN